jgi:hypothetical protein
MKLLKVLSCIFIIFSLIVLNGCQALIGVGPQVGKYEYTHNALYTGTPKRVIPVWIDKNFSDYDKASIREALGSWNFALNGYIKINIVDTLFDMEVPKIVEQVRLNGWLIMKINSHSVIVPENDKGYQTIGFTNDIGGYHLYLVRDRLSEFDVYGVTLHEVGHLLGAGHVGNRLMAPHYDKAVYQCIDWESILAVSKYNALDPARMNFCVDSANDSGTVRTEGGVTFVL